MKMERPPMEMALSTDVVMDIILSHLKVQDLLNCRKASKFWNKAASSVLRRRSTIVRNILEEKDLMKLEECMTKSLDFPFTGLKFGSPWKLTSPVAMEFFKNSGARFTRLHLGTSWETRFEEIAPILNHFPRLSILEAGNSYGLPPRDQLSDSAGHDEDDRILNLPSLRTLRISSGLNADVLRQVFTAASPSLHIECLSSSCMNYTYRILRALKNAGKLQALSVLNVNEDADEDEEDYAMRVDLLLLHEPPALTKLDFSVFGCISRRGLMKLLISSQHTLKELRLAGVCPSEVSSECPVLVKLTTLSLCIKQSWEYVFQGSHGHKFPALKELKLDTTWNQTIYNLSDWRFIVPSVTRMDVDGYVSEDGMTQLARTFPNVIEIGVQYKHYSGDEREESGRNPFQIWSVRKFEHLEKLRIWNFSVQLVRPTKTYVSMDGFLTGIPLSIRQNLQKQKRELMLNLIKSPFGESFSEVLRENPNILQLKNLKELTVCIDRRLGSVELSKDNPFMSMISVWYALEMMPNLRAKFVCEHPFPDSGLVSAFEHVQDYIKLEPFFY